MTAWHPIMIDASPVIDYQFSNDGFNNNKNSGKNKIVCGSSVFKPEERAVKLNARID